MTDTLDTVMGSTVYGPGGDKIGKVKEIYLDNDSGKPTWVAVSTGWFGSNSLVPLAGARHEKDALRVAVDKKAVKSAPHLDNEGRISVEGERELFQHYGIDPSRAGWEQYPAAGGPSWYSKPQPAQATAGAPAEAGTAEAGRTGESMIRSEERLKVGTQREAAGTARLRKYVVTEQQSVSVPVSHEEARVEREPITDASTTRAAPIGEDEAEVTLHEDTVHVDKESVPVERVHLAVDEVRGEQTVTDEVRKERIDDRIDPETGRERER